MTVEFMWPKSIDLATGQGIVALYNDAIASTTVIGYTKPLEDEGAALIEDLQQALEKDAIALFLIRKGQEVIGMAIISSTPMHNCRHIAEISKGIIRSDHQKSGILRSGFLDIARYCEENGHELIKLDVRENSVPHQIWSALGFTEYGRLDDYARVDGVSHPGVYLCQMTADLKERLSKAPARVSPAFMEKEAFKIELRRELETRITLTHPIVRRIVADKPDWELLRYMTLQGYQLTKHFLEYIETLYHHCPRNVHKRRLLHRKVVTAVLPSIENRMLTRNLKCDRRGVYRYFQSAIEAGDPVPA